MNDPMHNAKTITLETKLTPAERRELAIVQSAATLVRQLLAEKLSDVEDSAARQAEDGSGEDDKPPTAKVSVSIEWPAGAQSPDVAVSLAYNLRRKSSGTIKADADQLKLGIEQENQ